MVSVVLGTDIRLLTMTLKASTVLPFSNSDNVELGIGTVVVVVTIPTLFDSVVVLEISVAILSFNGFEVNTGFVTCSVLVVARIVVIDGILKASSVVSKLIVVVADVVLLLEIAGAFMLAGILVLLGTLNSELILLIEGGSLISAD